MSDNTADEGLKNQVKGTAKEVGGKLRNALGGLTSDTSEQVKGKAKELEGKVQRKYGEAQTDSQNDSE